MGFTKYQKVEKVEVEAKNDAERIREGVSHFGKTSAAELSPSEKSAILNKSQ